eukprot:CAMPEP_0172714390 /NCGR_PEP_ID=MMETSP1074-20121228/65598_1 /TAXON_ID=2916 /ORGANISM="Ceratium fusus, Strain PA161109" /LENGTH=61 /DNA_ID=CAMNT_0013538789 /DNA_START=46 /DNA_END=228 /DNA_ORIENTATION=+
MSHRCGLSVLGLLVMTVAEPAALTSQTISGDVSPTPSAEARAVAALGGLSPEDALAFNQEA